MVDYYPGVLKLAGLTLEDIAEQAGVSRSTVSRVVNEQPNVRDSVRRRVLKLFNPPVTIPTQQHGLSPHNDPG